MKKFASLVILLLLALAACSGEETPPPTTTASPAPATPTAAFSYYLGLGGYPFLITETVEEIPANSRVRLASSYFDGTTTLYTVVAEDETLSAEVRQDQLTFAPDVTPNAPLPTPAYQGYIGMGLLFITNEQIGDIPAETRVRISHGQPRYDGWAYVIVTEDEQLTATAREAQIRLAPDVTTGGTPTPNAVFSQLAGIGGYPFVTTEQVGTIPANTRVNLSATTFNGIDTIYILVAADGNSGEALESQFTLAPDVTPGAPVPTSAYNAYGGMGTMFVTTEELGTLPAGTRVGISHSQVNYDGWVYFLVAADGTMVEARESQFTFAPDVTPGPTPTR